MTSGSRNDANAGGAPDVTVLIATYNRAAMLDETLTWLARMRVSSTLAWDAIVIDNNSADDTRAVVERHIPDFPVRLRYLFEGRQGRSSALNAGIAAAGGSVLAFTDDDVRVADGWLDAAATPLLSSLPGADSSLAYAGGPVRPIWGTDPPDWLDLTRGDLWGTIAIQDHGDTPFIYEEARKVPLGANMAVRRDVFARIGGFRADLGRSQGRLVLGQEVPELLLRAGAAGLRGMYVPGMQVHHHVPASRLTPQYFRRWWFGKGVSREALEQRQPITELGVDLRTTPHVLGVPRFMYGTALRSLAGILREVLRGRPAEAFRHQMMTAYFAGYCWSRWRRRGAGLASMPDQDSHAPRRVICRAAADEPAMPTAPSRRLRIAIVAPSMEILGGQAVQAERLVRAWSGDPDVHAWLVPINPAPPAPFRFAARVKYLRTVVTQLTYWPLLLRELRRADIVHVFSASYFSFLLAPLPAVLIARLLGKPVVMNYRSGEGPDHLKRSRVARATLRAVDRNAVPSRFLRDVFAQFGIASEVIPNIVDLERFAYRPRGPLHPRLLSTRNFEPLYNVACTLRAFRLVQDRHPDAALVLVGAGSQDAPLRQLAASLGLRNVRFAGRVPPLEMWQHYADADIYLQTPNIDNMPASVLEAFASGCAVVATNAGGVPAILTDGVHGLLVGCDDHQAAADGILRLIAEPTLGSRLTASARESCEPYRWEAVRAQWVALYRGMNRSAGMSMLNARSAGL